MLSYEVPFPAETLYSFDVDVKRERKEGRKKRIKKEKGWKERKGRREGGRKERKRKKP